MQKRSPTPKNAKAGGYHVRADGTTVFKKKNIPSKSKGEKENHFRPPQQVNKTKKKVSYRSKLERNKQIVLADSDAKSGLDLFCYTKCDNTSPLQVKRARGLVFKGDSLILKTFPYTDEYSLGDMEAMTRFVKPIFNDPELLKETRFFRSYEGSLVRVFCFGGGWYLSTHRKLDAFKSKWSSSASFGQMFIDALREEYWLHGQSDEQVKDFFFSKLDPLKSYMFLVLPNKENRVVCKAPEKPTVYHVGTYENFPSDVFSLDEEIIIPHPEEYNFQTFEELENEMRKVDPDEYQGIIIFGAKRQLIKILEPRYFYLFDLRGNEQSIKFRYLQIRSDGDKWKDFGELYPEHIPDFKDYDQALENIARDIYTAYVRRYIKKEKIVVPQEEFQVMKKCQQWYQENTKKNKVSLKTVTEAMEYENPTSLNRMIKRLKLEERQSTREEITGSVGAEETEEIEITLEENEPVPILSLDDYPVLGQSPGG